MYVCILDYLEISKVPPSVQPNQRRQCKNPEEREQLYTTM